MKIAKKLCLFLTAICLVLLFVLTMIAISSEITVGYGHPFWALALYSGLGAFLFGIGAVFL